MPIKEKTTFKKHEYVYESPDNDEWDFVVMEYEKKRLIQFKRVKDKEFTTMDGEMLLEMANAYRQVLSPSTASLTLAAPDIKDHRGLDKSEIIQTQVDKSMQNQDHSISPVENLSPTTDDYAGFRTGVDISSQKDVPDTPDEYAFDGPGKESPQWKKDAMGRKGKQKPSTKQHGNEGTGFKRVGAGDLI